MATASFESDSNSSSSSDNDLSLTKQSIHDPLKDFLNTESCSDVSLIVSSMVSAAKCSLEGLPSGRCYIRRDRGKRHDQIVNDYFKGENSKYTPQLFRRRFRMDIELFTRILQDVENYDSYFRQKVDAVGNIGLSPLQKMVAAIRMLAYGCPANLLDEYVQIGETTAIESLKHFCDAIIGVYEAHYLRNPSMDDIRMLLKEGESRGFPGMLGSLDCMHWQWKNCPSAWHGTHTNGFKRVPTLILEIVASQSLWIWHAFFGMTGSNNDITVLDRSPLFDDLINGVAPPCKFIVQGNEYNMGYYLADGIYPQYATLIQTISQPSSVKEKLFAKLQESTRKDVERAFGVLQSWWHIVKGPARFWSAKDLGKIMKTCIILHNMIIENERTQGIDPEDWQAEGEQSTESVTLENDFNLIMSMMINRTKQVQNIWLHRELKNDLINHLWEVYGGQVFDS
ncbi:unnamed protein product [Cuscuta europaea]|uniref:Nuclease HARBI1 n=1 Tax=Cuscuta europaea TaxID=41803 RepID=A0A9P0ZMY2_CUSEU|nr:unnamed protein product [Cuscuta europaea]